MAERGTLHKNKLVEFKQWLVEDGWTLELTKGEYERVRARKGKKLLQIYDNAHSAHLSYSDSHFGVVNAFLRRKKHKREGGTDVQMQSLY